MITAVQLRAFLARPWARLRTLKERHVSSIIDREGADAAFDIAATLREHAIAMGALESEDDRANDLDSAVRLRRLLDRAEHRRRHPR